MNKTKVLVLFRINGPTSDKWWGCEDCGWMMQDKLLQQAANVNEEDIYYLHKNYHNKNKNYRNNIRRRKNANA